MPQRTPRNIIVITLLAVLALMTGCTGGNGSGTNSEADSIYRWENI